MMPIELPSIYFCESHLINYIKMNKFCRNVIIYSYLWDQFFFKVLSLRN